MKNTILTAFAVIITAGALAQGTVNLSTTPSAIGSDQKMLLADCVTPISGADGYVGQLYMGTSVDSLAPAGTPSPFLTGVGAGYWKGNPNPLTTTFAANSTVLAALFFWKGGDKYPGTGPQWGQSAIFQVELGGGGEPPRLPGNLVNFKSFCLIPEPSTIALGVLGAAPLLFFRRK